MNKNTYRGDRLPVSSFAEIAPGPQRCVGGGAREAGALQGGSHCRPAPTPCGQAPRLPQKAPKPSSSPHSKGAALLRILAPAPQGLPCHLTRFGNDTDLSPSPLEVGHKPRRAAELAAYLPSRTLGDRPSSRYLPLPRLGDTGPSSRPRPWPGQAFRVGAPRRPRMAPAASLKRLQVLGGLHPPQPQCPGPQTKWEMRGPRVWLPRAGLGTSSCHQPTAGNGGQAAPQEQVMPTSPKGR